MEKEDEAGFQSDPPSANIEYYDEEGNLLPEEEALREYLFDQDGQVVGSYLARNQTVVLIKMGPGRNLFPIQVYSSQDLVQGHRIMDLINVGFGLLYLVEAALLLAVYYKKRLPPQRTT